MDGGEEVLDDDVGASVRLLVLADAPPERVHQLELDDLEEMIEN